MEDRTPAIGVFAPASALTTVRDKLPETAKPEFMPAAILAKPRAISSWLLFRSSRFLAQLPVLWPVTQ